jgi:hypothetical protein
MPDSAIVIAFTIWNHTSSALWALDTIVDVPTVATYPDKGISLDLFDHDTLAPGAIH